MIFYNNHIFPLLVIAVISGRIAIKFKTDIKDAFTLQSGINVGPTLIYFGPFSRPYSLIRDYIKDIQVVIHYIEHVYLMPYVYSFCPIFQALRLFPALRLFRTLEYRYFHSTTVYICSAFAIYKQKGFQQIGKRNL